MKYAAPVFVDEKFGVYEEIYDNILGPQDSRRYYWALATDDPDKRYYAGPFPSILNACKDFEMYDQMAILYQTDLPENVIRVDFKNKRRIKQ